jgi:exonuclease III
VYGITGSDLSVIVLHYMLLEEIYSCDEFPLGNVKTDLMDYSMSKSVQYTRQGIKHKFRYSVEQLNHVKPRSGWLISSVATKGNIKACNLGYQQIDVHLLRVVSDVAVVDINKCAYRNRQTKSRFRSRQSSGGKSNDKSSGYGAYLKRCSVQVDQKAKSVLVAAVQIQEIRFVMESNCVSDSELLDVTAAAVVVDRQCERVNRGSGSAVVVTKCKYVNTRVRRLKSSNIVHKKRSVGGSTKRKIKFGSRNVRSLSEAFRNEDEMLDTASKVGRPLNTLPALMDQMVRLDVDFMGVQETKLKGSGLIKDQEVTLFYSGGLDISKERMHAGVGVLVRNKWVKDIEKVFYTFERMMWLKGYFDGEKMAVVVTYAPTDMYAVEDKDRYYEELEALYISISKEYKVKVILGDFNARIGEYMKDVWGKVRGRHMGGYSNDNGDFLFEFCVRNIYLLVVQALRKKITEHGRVQVIN